jgi:hypothetical protein
MSYFFMQEWPEESYPPWAHGPGYIVSQDIAKEVYRKHKRGELKVHALLKFVKEDLFPVASIRKDTEGSLE